MLGGLHAGQLLKDEILRDAQRAAAGETVRRSTPWTKATARQARTRRLRLLGAVCAAALVVGIALGAPNLLGRNTPEALIDTQKAGQGVTLSGGRETALDMPRGSVVITQRSQPAYRGVWEAAQGANFPLIRVDGRYYRMMTHPTDLGSDLRGDALGTVDVFTSEPALAENGTISNVAAQGETVYAVRGMNGAAVAASVNGSLRVFQRVSYGASALRDRERLADTLGTSPAVALELTGVGTVTDPAQAQKLMKILTDHAQLERAGTGETEQSLLIALQNGLTLQMSVRDETLMACGSWSCPEFFEAFEAAVK